MATYRTIRDKEIKDLTKKIIERYKSTGWKTPDNKKPTLPISQEIKEGKNNSFNHTPMLTLLQAISNVSAYIAYLIREISYKITGSPVEHVPPEITHEPVKVKVKKHITNPEPMVDHFNVKHAYVNGSPVNLISEWDNMYAQRQRESLHGRLDKNEITSKPIDSREGRNGWIQAYNATHANDFDSDPLIPKKNSINAITFKLKEKGVTIPQSTQTVYLGQSRVDGCKIYRYYGKDIDAIKQHYNIEELYE